MHKQTVTKMYHWEWTRRGREVGKALPPITATQVRKVAVTALRESGGSQAHQRMLARQMAHKLSTADKAYDKAAMTREWSEAVQQLQKVYKVS